MIAKLLEKLLSAVIKKERAIAMAVSFVLGAVCTAMGVKVDRVYEEICKNREVIQIPIEEQ